MPTPSFTSSRRFMRGMSAILLIAAVAIAYGAFRMVGSGSGTDSQTSVAISNLLDAAIEPSIAPATQATEEQTVVLAGGCFWGMEAVFEHVKGVSKVVSGFSGGKAATAHYEQVSAGETGHAEAVKITYDPSQVSYGQLLKIYFAIAHDPTQLNRQGPDWGTQYRSVIFFANDQQRRVAQAYIDRLNQAHIFRQAIATQLVPLTGFYAAEDYHQNFIDRNPNYPYVVVNDLPKLDRLRSHFPDLYKHSSN